MSELCREPYIHNVIVRLLRLVWCKHKTSIPTEDTPNLITIDFPTKSVPNLTAPGRSQKMLIISQGSN